MGENTVGFANNVATPSDLIRGKMTMRVPTINRSKPEATHAERDSDVIQRIMGQRPIEVRGVLETDEAREVLRRLDEAGQNASSPR
jgi:hypothetical protein